MVCVFPSPRAGLAEASFALQRSCAFAVVCVIFLGGTFARACADLDPVPCLDRGESPGVLAGSPTKVGYFFPGSPAMARVRGFWLLADEGGFFFHSPALPGRGGGLVVLHAWLIHPSLSLILL